MTATLWRSEIGTVDYAPGTILLNTIDNLSTITTAGYLNNAAAASSVQIRPTDFIMANYGDGSGLFTVTIAANGVITMVQASSLNGAVVLAPTADQTITAHNLILAAGQFISGTQGSNAGEITLLSSSANGSLQMVAAPCAAPGAGAIITNGNFNQSTTFTIPDYGYSTNTFVMTQGTQTLQDQIYFTNSVDANGGLYVGGPGFNGQIAIVPTSSIGNHSITIASDTYGQDTNINIPDPGASSAKFVLNTGATTMAAGSKINLDKGTGTEASNAVTISHQSGVITTSALTTAAGSTYTITLTNTKIATSSVVLVSLMGGSNTTLGVQLSATAGSGSSTITIANINATDALNGTLIIGFTVL